MNIAVVGYFPQLRFNIIIARSFQTNIGKNNYAATKINTI